VDIPVEIRKLSRKENIAFNLVYHFPLRFQSLISQKVMFLPFAKEVPLCLLFYVRKLTQSK